jgi:hypothetical protein
VKRVALIAAAAGALVMLIAIGLRWHQLAFYTNPLGVMALRLYRGAHLAPSALEVLIANVWLACTGAMEFALLAVLVARFARR